MIAPVGTLTIPPGARQFSLQIPTVADGASEGDEELLVRLVDGASYDLGDPASASTLLSSGDLPEVSITGGAVVNEGGTIKLALSGGDAGGDVQVALTITGTATAATDFIPITPVVTLNNGTSATFDVTTLTDTVIEPDETIIVSIAQSPNYKVAKISSAVITIKGASGDAAKPTFTLTPLTTNVTEGSPVQLSLSANASVADRRRAVPSAERHREHRHRLPATGGAPRRAGGPVIDDGLGADGAGRRRRSRRGDLGLPRAERPIPDREPGGRQRDARVRGSPRAAARWAGTAGSSGGSASRLAIVADQAPVKDTTVNYSVQGSAQPGQDFEPLTGTAILRAGQTSVVVAVLTVDESVVFLPTDMIVGAWPTRLGQVFVKEGDLVPAGTPLLSLTETELHRHARCAVGLRPHEARRSARA